MFRLNKQKNKIRPFVGSFKKDPPWGILLVCEIEKSSRTSYSECHNGSSSKPSSSHNQSGGLIRDAYEKALEISTWDRVLVIHFPEQAETVRAQLPETPVENLLVCPHGWETGPAFFIAMAHLMEKDPHASVVIFPGLYFDTPPQKLLRLLSHALERDYFSGGMGITLVSGNGFAEENACCDTPQEKTTIFAGHVRTFWYFLWKKFPHSAIGIDFFLRKCLNSRSPEKVLTIFQGVHPFNFYSFLEELADQITLLPTEGKVRWCTLNSKEITETLLVRPKLVPKDSNGYEFKSFTTNPEKPQNENTILLPQEEFKMGLSFREMREERGLSLGDLADLSGIPIEIIKDIEAGVQEVSVEHIERTFQALQNWDGWENTPKAAGFM